MGTYLSVSISANSTNITHFFLTILLLFATINMKILSLENVK